MVGAATWVVVIAVMTFPPPVAGPAPGPDAQWILGLDLAARAHLQAGTDMVWTYGPLGFLGEPMYFFASQWILATAFLVLVHFGLFTCLAVLFRRWQTPPWTWLVAGVALVLPQFFGGFADREGLLLSGLLFLVAADGLHRAAWRGWLVGAALYSACLALVVTTALVVAVADVVLFAVVALVARRPRAAAAAPVLFGVLLLAVWLAIGQSLGTIPAFLRATYEILTWYPATLALQPSPSWLVAGTATVAVVGLGAVTAIVAGARRLGLLLLFATPTVFVLFRDAFVRFDIPRVHIYLSLLLVVGLLAFGIAMSPVADEAWRKARRWGRGIGALAVAIAVLLVWVSMGSAPFGSVADSARGLAHMVRLAVDSSAQSRTAAAAKRYFASEIPLSGSTIALLRTGTVEPMPWDVAAVYAYDLRWDPQPVLQSYTAFSAYLDTLDAEHLAAHTPPDFVLLSTETIDGRYNPFDEPAVFRTLLDWYAPAGPPDGNQLVLQPRAAPVDDHQTPLSDTCGPFARRIDVPSVPGRLVFADVTVTESPLGRTLSTLFAPAWVTVVLDLSDGSNALFRLAPGTASDGLFMSGYAADAGGLHDIFTGRATPSVASFALSTIAPADYGSTVCVHFWSQAAP